MKLIGAIVCLLRGHLRNGEMRWAQDRKDRINYLNMDGQGFRRVEIFCSRCERWRM